MPLRIRQFRRIERSTAKKPRALPGGLPKKLRQKLKTKSQPPLLDIFGVEHTTFKRTSKHYPLRNGHYFEPSNYLSKLMIHIHRLKKRGVTTIGVENLGEHITPEERKDKEGIARYWRALHLCLSRIGIKAVSIEDPTAEHIYNAFVNVMRSYYGAGQHNYHNEAIFEKYFSKKDFPIKLSSYDETDPIEDALTYFRSTHMYENAMRMKLRAIIVGDAHREDLPKRNVKRTEVNMIDDYYFQNKRRRLFIQYQQQIVRLWKDIKSGKITLE